ncbi:DUF4059 family protein [Streptococcus sp. zg-JUN1979]
MVQFYGLGLLCSFVSVVFCNLIWLLIRMRLEKDKTFKERQSFLYDMTIITVITVPILAFAFATVFIMLRA